MAQIIKTAAHGQIVFERTFINNNVHVGKLPSGKGYCTLGGVPISDKEQLLAVIPKGQELDEALFWWDHKDDIKAKDEAPPRIVVTSTGNYEFIDGSPVTKIEDLINSIAAGPALEAAVKWFSDGMNGLNKKVFVSPWDARKGEQCMAAKPNGSRCLNIAVPGTKYCKVPQHAALGMEPIAPPPAEQPEAQVAAEA